MKIISSFAFTLLFTGFSYAQNGNLTVKVIDEKNSNVSYAIGSLQGFARESVSDEKGEMHFSDVTYGTYTVKLNLVGYSPVSKTVYINAPEQSVTVTMISISDVLDEIEVFGDRNKKPKGLEMITRMPLRPSDQIQSISVISSKVITDQGALTLTDAVRNIPGVTLFGSYGGVKESMSTRGFRGVPVLKNGVRMDSQLQTASGVVDMQGVESIQMIKGSAAITQGVITDIGNAGGVINVVTKTPTFENSGNVGIRVGSWGQFRPVFDVQTILDTKETVGFRINGAYESADSYRVGLHSKRVYVNPSLTWKASDRTTITIEGDYFNDDRVPSTSAINLASGQAIDALYVIPKDKFLGFNSDSVNTRMSSFMARFDHDLSDKFKIRAALAKSSYKVDNLSTAANEVKGSEEYNLRQRSVSRSLRDDKNTTFQFDLIGQDLYTGSVKHLAQLGIDYRMVDATTNAMKTNYSNGKNFADVIDVFGNFTNTIGDIDYVNGAGETKPLSISFDKGADVVNQYNTFGIMAQDVIEFNKYLKGFIGVRYSEIYTKDPLGTKATTGTAWNPSIGVMVTPFENFNVFGSYTNSTNLRSEANLMSNLEKIGASKTEQFEAGIKSDWLENRLRFNFTYFHIFTANLANQEYVSGTNQTTGYYFKAGDLVRDGFEVELNGRVLDNLTVMLGYAFLNARYENSPSYVNGSAPMNAPKHTGNAWVQYNFNKGSLNGLSLSAGVYYVGDRPVNEYSLKPDGHGNLGGEKPFDMPGYTTLNAQIGYKYKSINARLYMNNLTNTIGLNSYFRGGYINQTDPRNVALSVSYSFK